MSDLVRVGRCRGQILAAAALVLSSWFPTAARAMPAMVTVGDFRLQAISPTLLRLEMKGPHGFEDRPTFHVLNRDGAGATLLVEEANQQTIVHGPDFNIALPAGAHSLAGVTITAADGQRLWSFDQLPPNHVWLPDPASHPAAWAFADTPRLARSDAADAPRTGNVGWDASNDAADVYVFLPHGNCTTLRRDFLHLTGPTEMAPLYDFGAWDSRWFEYTDKTALQQIDDYRSRQFPLDGLVVDTDWRVGGSHGYQVNRADFPDLPAFFAAVHQKHAHVMFNDHPEPIASALDPKELQYRSQNLTRLLNEGLDVWWFDRNWGTHLGTPMRGLRLEAWGIELYHDVTAAVRPDRRPLIMANVVGIDNGQRHQAPDVATHRYPMQWTGDIGPSYQTLAQSVANAVHAGVANCFAYESDDLGGHVADPTPEGFVRWIEYGSLSPIYRPHCTKNHQRMPWAFGAEAEGIARQYVQMRYRLLPTLYAAAHENYVNGEPILRRLDLDYPDQPMASREDQYLIGHGLLVAPVMEGTSAAPAPDKLPTPQTRQVWIPPGTWTNLWTGQTTTGPSQIDVTASLNQLPLFTRAGTILLLAPDMLYTDQKPWSPITIDLYPDVSHAAQATLYEDDGISVGYQHGAFRTTRIAASAIDAGGTLRLNIAAADGTFDHAPPERGWVLRIHELAGHRFSSATINGQAAQAKTLPREGNGMPLSHAAAPDGDVVEVSLPTAAVTQPRQVVVQFSGT